MKKLTKKQWLRRKRRYKYGILIFKTTLIMISLGIGCFLIGQIFNEKSVIKTIGELEATEMFLTPNAYSRPQTPLKRINSVVIHYTGNPGTSAKANRNYFESLSIKKNTSASSHFVIGLEGEIIQCIPLDEVSYASNDRNNDTIAIECCHEDETGKFNELTYDSLVKLVAWICCEYNLDEDDIIRHYDVTGKKCPLYFVDHEDEWVKFKNDVMKYIDNNSITE